jgi:hypothetical protein
MFLCPKAHCHWISLSPLLRRLGVGGGQAERGHRKKLPDLSTSQ